MSKYEAYETSKKIISRNLIFSELIYRYDQTNDHWCQH